ncbi:unknown [Clostridium sp. CAG:356]|nr:unknown [Clostridium sp. CAG:356]
MAKASSKKTKKDSVTEEPKETKSNENQKNMEDLKDILQDLKTVLSNLGVNISQLEVSLSSSQETSEEKRADEPTDNDTLLISETQNKVVLPYKIKDVEKALSENSQYKTIEDVINVEYTLPLDKYKNSTKSRFKEAYNLMRKKEKASIFDSLSLATEVTFNNLLNPAIITACQNLDQLDVYLDCLSSNKLDKFNYFKVKYEILPKK